MTSGMFTPRSLPPTSPTATIDGLVLRHLDWMRVRNLSPLTITQRRTALARLSRHIGGPVLYAGEDQLSGWQSDRARSLAPATRRTELSTVREFYRWAVRERYRSDDPTLNLPMPRAPRRLPRPMADGPLAEAIGEADPVMAVILGLAAFAGLRAVEVARLDWSEVALTGEPLLHVARGKGDRSRTLPLSPALARLLTRLPHRHGPVVPRGDGGAGHTSANAVTKRASYYLHGRGYPETLHCLRHRFCTSAYRACRDIRAVQEVMGHASPTTTAAYAAASVGVARDAVYAAGDFAA